MDFSEILYHIKSGSAARRAGWTVPHQTLTGSDWSCFRDRLRMEEGSLWIDVSEVRTRWFATDADLLSSDWELIQ